MEPDPNSNITDKEIKLARNVASKYIIGMQPHLRSRFQDDIRSDALLGLVEADKNYNPDLGVPFHFFAYPRIRGAILDGMRRQGFSENRLPAGGRFAHVAFGRSEDPSQPIEFNPDTVISDHQKENTDKYIYEYELKILVEKVDKWVSENMSIRANYVYNERMLGRKERDIGIDLGVSESRVSQILAKIRQRLLAAQIKGIW